MGYIEDVKKMDWTYLGNINDKKHEPHSPIAQ